MNKIILILFFLLLKATSFCQGKTGQITFPDSMLHKYLQLLSESQWNGGPFLKTYFQDTRVNGANKLALIQKSSIVNYLIKRKGLTRDSAQITIERNIFFHNPYRLEDSLLITPSLNSFMVGSDSLAALHKLSVKEVIDKYFDLHGRIRSEFLEKRFLLACYFFDRFVVVRNPDLYEEIDFVKTRILLRNNWLK